MTEAGPKKIETLLINILEKLFDEVNFGSDKFFFGYWGFGISIIL